MKNNKGKLLIDIKKLLVSTPPALGDIRWVSMITNNKGVVAGSVLSGDAPDDAFQWRTESVSVGAEYSLYNNHSLQGRLFTKLPWKISTLAPAWNATQMSQIFLTSSLRKC